MRGTSRIISGLSATALAIALTACSGDDDASPDTTAQPPATTAPTSAVVPTTPGTGGPTTAPAPSTPGSAPQFSGDPDSAFCQAAGELDEIDSEPDNPFDSEFYEGMLTTMSSLYDELAAAAPPELAADVTVEVDSFAELVAEFTRVDFEFLDVNLSAVPDSPELDAARARVSAYLGQVCDIERDADAGPPPGDGTVRDLLIEQFTSNGATPEQADCMVDVLAEAPNGSDAELGIAAMAGCGYTQPLVELGFTPEEAECAVDHLSNADITTGSDVELGIALVAACGITQPLVDAGFTPEEADCVVDTLAADPDIDVNDSTQLGLEVIDACSITRFFTERGFSEEQAQCMIDSLAGFDDLSDEDAVLDQVVAECVTEVPPTTAG